MCVVVHCLKFQIKLLESDTKFDRFSLSNRTVGFVSLRNLTAVVSRAAILVWLDGKLVVRHNKPLHTIRRNNITSKRQVDLHFQNLIRCSMLMESQQRPDPEMIGNRM